MKPDYDIHRKQHFVTDWKDEAFLAFLREEGFTCPLVESELLADHGFLCIDMQKRTFLPMGGLSPFPASQGLVMSPNEFKEICAGLEEEEQRKE